MKASPVTIGELVREGLPLFQRQMQLRRGLNLLFMRAWRAGSLQPTWETFRAHRPMLYLHYFVRARGLGDIKIGKSNDIFRRFRFIHGCCSRGADLVACYPAGIEHETELFADFAASRLCGEWFRCDPDLADYLSAIGSDAGCFPDSPPQAKLCRTGVG
jgi:hypothetical protein